MTKRNDTTVAINGDRKTALQDAAVEITIATRKPVKPSVIVHYLIDTYLKDAVKDLKDKEKIKSA
ncbi:hypothetical protein AYJ58_13180 [Shewanella sp. Pdp11]|uniref:hypothetical protein n=1 Tax=Shewanella sp. Pdp11 TaxID=2059264 RepID=UPI000CA099FC|nr:hypothetical protein [Shewanella sp. Pdp11]AUD61985.1 hypothetical protein AYJ58_13135 [Shewanella sp. Pdp11]AUD61986.1 hypothetical protein AYJ58_13180 [Shewanella sp. Pdp11]